MKWLWTAIVAIVLTGACGPGAPEVEKKQGALDWFDSGPLVVDWCPTHPSDPACTQPMQPTSLRKCNDIYDLTVHQYCQTSTGLIYASLPGTVWPDSARTDPFAYCEHWQYNPDGTILDSEPVGQACTMDSQSGVYNHVVICVSDCFASEYAYYTATGYNWFFSPWR